MVCTCGIVADRLERLACNAESTGSRQLQALIQNKIGRQRVRSRESGRKTIRGLWKMVFGVETGGVQGEEDELLGAQRLLSSE